MKNIALNRLINSMSRAALSWFVPSFVYVTIFTPLATSSEKSFTQASNSQLSDAPSKKMSAKPSPKKGKLKIGDTATVPKWQLVNVENEVKNINKAFKKGEQCGLIEGHKVKIVALTKDKKEATLKFDITFDTAGQTCPKQATFKLNTDEVMTFDQRYAEQRFLEKMQDEFEKIMKGNGAQKAGSFSVGDLLKQNNFGDVNLMRPILESKRLWNIGESCKIDKLDELTVAGVSMNGDFILFEKKFATHPKPHLCPKGALFMLPLAEI